MRGAGEGIEQVADAPRSRVDEMEALAVLALQMSDMVDRGDHEIDRHHVDAVSYTHLDVYKRQPYTSIGKLVPQLRERIEEVRRETGADQVVLIAHSMGGLVCRSYLARHGGQRVERLVTIASPHVGTELARIGIGQNAREMGLVLVWFVDLATEAVPGPALSIRSPHYNYVMV